MAETEARLRHVGRPVGVEEDRRFVRGRGRYINDLELPGMLHVAVAPAPVAHARLVSVDVSEALKVPGVVTAITGADIVKVMKRPLVIEMANLPNVIWYPLVVDKIRLAGEWVAAIVAESRAVAEDAAELVTFEYEELAPVVDPEAALLPGAPILHEAHGSNLAVHVDQSFGDVEGAFARADRTFEYRYRWHRHSGVPLETFGAVAWAQPNGTLDVWASHQNPGIQQEMLDLLEVSRVRVQMDVDVGGSYGSKRGKKQMYITAVASLLTERPCKYIEDRVENMKTGDGHGPDRRYHVKVATTNDGIIQALDFYLLEDMGAYGHRGGIGKPVTALTGCYKVPNVRYHGDIVLTCKSNQVPFRGAGMSPHNFALERTIDQVARELGIDRIEIRKRNYIQKDEFPYRTPSGSYYDSGNYPEAMRLLIEKGQLELLLEEQRRLRGDGRWVGIGIAGCVEPSGGPPVGAGAAPEGARIQIDRRGRVVATIGFQSSGQAHETMVRQIVCEELGVDPEDVVIERAAGTGGIVGGATTGSRMTIMLGGALHLTTDKLRKKLREIAAHALEVDPEDVDIGDGEYHVKGATSRRKTLKELAALAYAGTSRIPEGMEPGLVEDVVYAGPRRESGFPSYAFDFHLAMVEVDPETYQISFRRYVIVHDCGTVINPLVVDGFVYGGVGHGVGGALYENFAYDEDGALQAATFMDYLLPTVAEIPRVELHMMVTPSPLHPYGAKGTGEGSYMTTPAVVASAVEDALAPVSGLRIDEIPISPTLLHQRLSALGVAAGQRGAKPPTGEFHPAATYTGT